jgi:hypothetical protein
MERKAVARARKTPTRSDPVHRQAAAARLARHPIADLQRSIGNRAVQRLINSPYIQTRLSDSSAGDQLVEEALMAGVMSAPDSFMSSQDGPAPLQKKCPACEAGQGSCPKCADNGGVPAPTPAVPAAPGPTEASPAVPAQAPPPPPPPPAVRTFTFISRGSYGETTPNLTRPSCAAGAAPGTSTMIAGSAAPTVAVFPTGTYQVRRDDGVVQTATCTRLAAGMAATRAHENHHVAGVLAGVVAANTAAGVPQNFATPALCTAGLPAALATWNTSIGAVLANEAAHGPGTDPPTAQTFPQEHAAGGCTFV